MVREIVKDENFLKIKSVKATILDLYIGKDLLDTLTFNSRGCVGLAANMIGYSKNIIAFNNGLFNEVFYNPEITKKSSRYKTEEGCLSLEGKRPCTRYDEIEVIYYDNSFKLNKRKFSGFVAEIIQHEIDHCHGIII